MTPNRDSLLAEMGITPRWRLRNEEPVGELSQGDAVATPSPVESSPDLGTQWLVLAKQVADCRACVLCKQRTQAVLGVGDRNPDWLFVGEGPGAEEDVKGEPFVGQAGKLLDAMLAAFELRRGEKVYIANAVKCRPPGNRTPGSDELAACHPFLEKQIELLRPRIIVVLGRPAAATVLGGDRAISALRGHRHEYRGIPVVVTYHPAYLLRNLPDKAKAWEDLLFARRILAEQPGRERQIP